jgi:osmotically-inducible protein OsmY
MELEDERLRTEIVEQLFFDDDVDDKQVWVAVCDGVAILEGTVPSQRAKEAAESDALATPDIARVDNRLEVTVQSLARGRALHARST